MMENLVKWPRSIRVKTRFYIGRRWETETASPSGGVWSITGARTCGRVERRFNGESMAENYTRVLVGVRFRSNYTREARSRDSAWKWTCRQPSHTHTSRNAAVMLGEACGDLAVATERAAWRWLQFQFRRAKTIIKHLQINQMLAERWTEYNRIVSECIAAFQTANNHRARQ